MWHRVGRVGFIRGDGLRMIELDVSVESRW